MSGTAVSRPGTATGATATRDSISFAPRTLSHSCRRSRHCPVVSGRVSRAHSARLRVAEQLTEPGEQGGVEVQPAEVGHPAGGDHP